MNSPSNIDLAAAWAATGHPDTGIALAAEAPIARP